jgi:hypothetical protein
VKNKKAMKYPKRMLVILPLLAVSAFVGFGLAKTDTVGAQQDPKQERIETLQKKYLDAVENAKTNGEFTTNQFGEKVYAGKTADDLKSLEKEVGTEIRELTARPAEDRAKAVEAVNGWNDKFLYTIDKQPKQTLQYAGRSGQVQGSKLIGAERYFSEDYQFTIDPQTNKVVEMYLRPKEVGEPAAFEDMTPRFTDAQLEQKARQLIEAQNLGVDLSSLKFEKNQKVGTFFYTWEGEKIADGVQPSLYVAFTQGGQLIGYINAGFFDKL